MSGMYVRFHFMILFFFVVPHESELEVIEAMDKAKSVKQAAGACRSAPNFLGMGAKTARVPGPTWPTKLHGPRLFSCPTK